MQFVDKTTLNQGAVLGIKDDCHLSVCPGATTLLAVPNLMSSFQATQFNLLGSLLLVFTG